MQRRSGSVVAVLTVLSLVGAGRVAAEPTAGEECRQLGEQKSALDKQGVGDRLAKGATAGASLSRDELQALADYLRLDASLRLRCRQLSDKEQQELAKPVEGEGPDVAEPAASAVQPEPQPSATPQPAPLPQAVPEPQLQPLQQPHVQPEKKSEDTGPATNHEAKSAERTPQSDSPVFADKKEPQPAAAEAETPAEQRPEWRRQALGNY